ncbi:MAG: DUF4416 family protein [candidate division Zixibacteria bacterium]
MPDGKPEVKPVKLICGITFAPSADLNEIDSRLESRFGPIDSRSGKFDFSFTDYYESEMGPGLIKRFLSFEKLIAPDQLAKTKNETLSIETEISIDGRRTVNLDPGYLEESKLVLASTKNFAHRIYLGDNIWGEVTLRYENGEFVTHPWTYPDYAAPLAFEYFKRVRAKYREQLSQ